MNARERLIEKLVQMDVPRDVAERFSDLVRVLVDPDVSEGWQGRLMDANAELNQIIDRYPQMQK